MSQHEPDPSFALVSPRDGLILDGPDEGAELPEALAATLPTLRGRRVNWARVFEATGDVGEIESILFISDDCVHVVVYPADTRDVAVVGAAERTMSMGTILATARRRLALSERLAADGASDSVPPSATRPTPLSEEDQDGR